MRTDAAQGRLKMTQRNDGGKVFPWCGDLNDCPTINLGISLRDYFAVKSLSVAWKLHKKNIEGCLYRDHSDGCETLLEVNALISYWQTDEEDPVQIAKIAYVLADSMLAARERS